MKFIDIKKILLISILHYLCYKLFDINCFNNIYI